MEGKLQNGFSALAEYVAPRTDAGDLPASTVRSLGEQGPAWQHQHRCLDLKVP